MTNNARTSSNAAYWAINWSDKFWEPNETSLRQRFATLLLRTHHQKAVDAFQSNPSDTIAHLPLPI